MTGCIFYACNIYRDTWNSGKLHYISAKKRQKPIAVEINFRCFVAFALSVFKCIFRMCRCPYRGVSRIGFLQRKQKGRKNPFFLSFFITVTICSSVLTWKGIASVFPAAASVISIVGFWKANPKISRKLAFPISTLMLSYDLTCNSHMGIVNEILTMCATAIAIIHNRKVDKNE